MKNIIFHADIDAFYASVEQRDNPSIKGKPVIVGALPGNRGVVSACSYEARLYGVRSAMPISQALSKCPHGIFLPVRMKKYLEASKKIMKTLKDFSPNFQQISVDEAFLDLSGTQRLLGPPHISGKRIKEKILKQEGLIISIGIAQNRFLAKLASKAGKPNGLFIVQAGKKKEEAFLDSLKLNDLWGVGEKTLARLENMNIKSIPHLRSFSLNMLSSILGDGTGRFLYNAVRGIDPGIFALEPKSHSISCEITFETDKKDAKSLENTLFELSSRIMSRLISENLKSRTLFVKVRFYDFTTTLAQKTVKQQIACTEEMYDIALSLFKKKWDCHTPVRLIGVGVSATVKDNFTDQGELFYKPANRRKQVEKAVLKINKKMPGVTLTRASLLKNVGLLKNDK